MATDRILHWADEVPSEAELTTLCNDYMGMAGGASWHFDRLVIRLKGYLSRALINMPKATAEQKHFWTSQALEPRVIEVFFDDEHVDVITRSADEFTCAVADGLVALIARHWGAKPEA